MSAATEIKKKKPAAVEFTTAGLSAMGAGFFTNPIEVIKIRLQLQGELEVRGTYQKLYKNTFHTAYVIAKNEGILALQSGIGSALAFQVAFNGIRIGSYKVARTYELTLNKEGRTDIAITALVSGGAACVGAVFASPFYLVKTRMQAQSAQAIAVGYQHGHNSEIAAFQSIWRERGFVGLFQSWYANCPRVFVGSATQLTMFSLIIDWLRPFPIFDDHPLILTFCSALIGGSCVALTTQPFDIISTRLYNQGTDSSGKPLYYRGCLDALIKISKTEGLLGLYKGTFPTWIRIAPHTVLCLCFYEQLELLYEHVFLK